MPNGMHRLFFSVFSSSAGLPQSGVPSTLEQSDQGMASSYKTQVVQCIQALCIASLPHQDCDTLIAMQQLVSLHVCDKAQGECHILCNAVLCWSMMGIHGHCLLLLGADLVATSTQIVGENTYLSLLLVTQALCDSLPLVTHCLS